MRLTFIAVENIPMVQPGDELAPLIDQGLETMGEVLPCDGVIVIAQKIISKSENSTFDMIIV